MTFYAYVDDNGISYVGYFAGNPHDRITVYSDGTNSLGWYDNGQDPNEKTKVCSCDHYFYPAGNHCFLGEGSTVS